ncbi:hypothetical protein Phou_044820 [Phytohabitans houttuyneae]|uniref:Gfo/Idh/MocA-like oxidoreductase N-terminal domain-containing protein n=1 Tax=Phytohabitans houttuyneae TaxID=1076126 RepID=A0A6V8K536_9ACTN|nr:hypothetical protein Phou_044820 [Phytohabitans houttuyneae]
MYVATPHSAHYAATRILLEAGRAVLCEKPFTLDLTTTVELIDMARDRGTFLMEAMWMRCNPAVLRMVELIRDGAIGEVTSVHADFGVAGPLSRATACGRRSWAAGRCWTSACTRSASRT